LAFKKLYSVNVGTWKYKIFHKNGITAFDITIYRSLFNRVLVIVAPSRAENLENVRCAYLQKYEKNQLKKKQRILYRDIGGE